ncbi:MAG: hypothetical protein KA781_02725 [Aquabacterium sp.]|nr:hypothetical protein [Aquabacterium sp.]
MPTYTFTRNREQFATKVALKLGVVATGETVGGNDLAVICEAIDLRLKELHVLGVLWWNVSGATTDVTLTGGVATATISATDYLFPVSMAVRVGTEDRPLEIIDHRAYQAITDKASQGEPENVFIQGSTARFYPVPSTAYTAKLTYQSIAEDSATSTPLDIRTEAIRSFIDVVAADLIEEYEVPEPKASRLMAKQEIGMRTLRALNQQRVSTATVTPDYF